MTLFNNNFQKNWEQLSLNVDELNNYTKNHVVELRDVKIKDKKLNGMIFNGGTFSGVEWSHISGKKSAFYDVTFVKCSFIESDFSSSSFVNVTFKDCRFIDSNINRSTIESVSFESCELRQMGLVNNKGTQISFIKSHIEDSGMGDCALDFQFINSSLDGVDLSTSRARHNIFIEKGILSDVDFGDSTFFSIIIKNARQGAGSIKFNDLSAESIVVENVDMTHGTAMARSTIGSVTILGGRFGTSFGHSKIGSISIRDVELTYMEFSRVNLPKVTITNCSLYDTAFYDGFIEELAVYNSKIDIVIGENFKADTVVWDNVTLDGKIDFTDAHIKDFQPSRITRGPNLNLITTGSNLKF